MGIKLTVNAVYDMRIELERKNIEVVFQFWDRLITLNDLTAAYVFYFRKFPARVDEYFNQH